MTAVLPDIRHAARGFVASARVNLLVAAQYRANMAIWSIASILQVVVYLSVWRAVADARGGTTGGYDAAGFAGYFLVLLVVRELTMTWLPWEFSGHVRSGKLATMLVRPLHPLIHIVAGSYAFRVQSLTVNLPVAVVLALVFHASIDTSLPAVLLALVVIPLASATRVLCDSLLAVTSLWLVRIDGIRGIYYTLLLLLGGQFAPLGVLPHWAQIAAHALPFWWALGFPVELLVGQAQPSQAYVGIAVLTAWVVGLYCILQPIWRRGTRAYEAVGS